MEATLPTHGETILWGGAPPRLKAATEDRAWVRWSCIGVTVTFLALLLFVPLATIFAEALRNGLGAYVASINEPYAWAAIRLTVLVAAISVPLNLVFGL